MLELTLKGENVDLEMANRLDLAYLEASDVEVTVAGVTLKAFVMATAVYLPPTGVVEKEWTLRVVL